MKPLQNTGDLSGYTVDFNADIAWTIAYDDNLGRLTFVFEPGETPKTIELDRVPIERAKEAPADDSASQSRRELALQRTKQFLASCGYDVVER